MTFTPFILIETNPRLDLGRKFSFRHIKNKTHSFMSFEGEWRKSQLG
jgi:hypothetical protein